MGMYAVLGLIAALSLVSLAILVAFAVHPPLRKALPFYDPIADWIGHGFPDVAMIYMVLVAAGAIPAFIPFSWCVAFFLASAAVFAVRIATNTSFVWWQDILHLLGVLTKAYMFMAIAYWHEVVTAHAIMYFAMVMYLYIYRTLAPIAAGQGLTFGRLLFNLEHIVMSVPAILMFALMQWPSAFPLEPGALCISR